MPRRQQLMCFLQIALIVTGLSLQPDARAADDDPGIWTIFSTTDAFQSEGQDSRWLYTVDAQARYFDLGSGINQWLARPGIGYAINDDMRAWAGYARFRSRNRVGNISHENRYWQQIDWDAGRWNSGRIALRGRLEQRDVSTGRNVGVVLRLMAKYVRPVGDDGSRNLVLSLEPFIDLKDTDWGGQSGFGQNRTFIGVGQRLSDRILLEAGYMHQYIRVDGAENRVNHLAIFNFKLTL